MATRPARKPFVVKPRSHLLVRANAMKSAVRPAEQAASVVLNETREMPWTSIAESVLPGLKPYQPNHRIRPPTAPRMMLCGSGGPPPSRAKTRPRRGPSAMAPASEMAPPIVWTTVDPAKSRNGRRPSSLQAKGDERRADGAGARSRLEEWRRWDEQGGDGRDRG